MAPSGDDLNATDPIGPIEKLLRESSAAESAGVFHRTPIDAGRLLRESSQVPVPLSVSIGRKWMPVAAAVGMAAVVWSAMFYVKLSEIGEQSRLVTKRILDGTTPDDDAGSVPISVCVGGPAKHGEPNCKDSRYDFDTDGDIDLADFSRYQLAFAHPGQ